MSLYLKIIALNKRKRSEEIDASQDNKRKESTDIRFPIVEEIRRIDGQSSALEKMTVLNGAALVVESAELQKFYKNNLMEAVLKIINYQTAETKALNKELGSKKIYLFSGYLFEYKEKTNQEKLEVCRRYVERWLEFYRILVYGKPQVLYGFWASEKKPINSILNTMVADFRNRINTLKKRFLLFYDQTENKLKREKTQLNMCNQSIDEVSRLKANVARAKISMLEQQIENLNDVKDGVLRLGEALKGYEKKLNLFIEAVQGNFEVLETALELLNQMASMNAVKTELDLLNKISETTSSLQSSWEDISQIVGRFSILEPRIEFNGIEN